MTPTKITKIEDLSSALEAWEEQLRLYEARKRSDGTRHILDDEIKISVVEHLCPVELEKHLQMNRSRYASYDDVRGEVVLFLESRLGSRMKVVDPGGAAPMDIGAFGKGPKGKGKKGGKGGGKKGSSKGKGKGGAAKGKGPGDGSKETRTCNNCGKVGHLRKDCWSAGGGAANKNQQPKSKGSSKKSGKGGRVSNLEEAEPEAETAETGYLSIAGLEEWSEDEEIKAQEIEEPTGTSSSTYVNVRVEPERYVMVKSEEVSCSEPCDCCLHLKCQVDPNERHFIHECGVCSNHRRKLVEDATAAGSSKSQIRNLLKITRPESFHYLVDKTICLFKGITQGAFHSLDEDRKDELRQVHDPLGTSRDENASTLKQLEASREEMRVSYFEKLSEHLVGRVSQTFGQRPTLEVDGPSRSSGSAEAAVPSRPIGSASSQVMHRTVEMLEVANLDAEKREKIQELENCEDEDEMKVLETRIKEIDERKNILKETIRDNDRRSKELKSKEGGFKLTAETANDQSWHDARYYAARKAGVTHSKAWSEEKKRRKATLHRRSGAPERAAERLRQDEAWHREFDTKKVKDEEYHDETLGGIETEAVVETEDGGIRVLRGNARPVRRGQLKRKDAGTFVKSARSYRKLTQDEVSKFNTETKEDEMKVMRKKRTNLFKMRRRVMTKEQKEQRAKRVKAAKMRKAKAYKVDPDNEFYLQHPKSGRMCADFRRSYCHRGAKCRMGHSELDREIHFIESRNTEVEKLTGKKQEINSFEEDVNSFTTSDGWTKLVVNFDTGAAITAVPRTLGEQGLVKGDSKSMLRSYKTASGEILEDEGGVVVKGLNNNGFGRSVDGRLVGVHRMLASGTAVAKKNMVVLEGDKGWILPKSGKIANGMRAAFKKLVEAHPKEADDLTELYEHKGIYVFDLWLNGTAKDKGFDHVGRDLGAVDEGFSRQAQKP